MIGFLLLMAIGQGDIGKELEHALVGKSLSGASFHEAIDPVLDKYGALKSAKFQRTVGDSRGMILTLAGSGPSWDSTKVWRLFLWPEALKIRAQVIDRFGDFNNSAIDSYTDGEIYWRGDRLTIAGRDLDGTQTSRAGLTSYQLKDTQWVMRQHLTSERQGFATFARLNKVIDPSRVLVKTRLRPANFSVPSGGPMLNYTELWVLSEGRYIKKNSALVKTAVAELDRLAGFAVKKDKKSFDAHVPENYQSLWQFLTRPNLMFESVDNDEPDLATKFRFDAEGLVIEFSKINGAWVISGSYEN